MARHATAIRSICTEAADEGEAAIPLVKRELSEPTKKKVAYQQRYTCAGCNCLLPPSYEVDHIVPLALGGTNGLKNLQALCVPCHTQKTRDQRHAILAARKQQRAANGGEVDDAAAPTLAEGLAAVEAAVGPAAQSAVAEATGSPSHLLSPLQLLRGMNRQQLAAVLATRGPVRLSAGPGTGKTRVLVARIAHLVGPAAGWKGPRPDSRTPPGGSRGLGRRRPRPEHRLCSVEARRRLCDGRPMTPQAWSECRRGACSR